MHWNMLPMKRESGFYVVSFTLIIMLTPWFCTYCCFTDVTSAWLITRMEMSCEYFPATMNITWPVSINGSKKFMGILLNILCSPLFCFFFIKKKRCFNMAPWTWFSLLCYWCLQCMPSVPRRCYRSCYREFYLQLIKNILCIIMILWICWSCSKS